MRKLDILKESFKFGLVGFWFKNSERTRKKQKKAMRKVGVK